MKTASPPACVNPAAIAAVRGAMPSESVMEEMAGLLEAMGDRTRLKLLLSLLERELCVHELALLTGLSVSAVSHQLRRLRDLRLVRPRRQGRVVYYRLEDEHVGDVIRIVRAHAEER
ncbi:MAG: metalloregulator ArsR/SmtB family transcription factor [Bacteroidota bacterium]|nr:metalloregulator ArsR/SmtB family transcription factor [Rhodothermia bacterium]MCS7154325.1 metalloregulator ArsR/SmtB family transcription factor [Bacteroidota bacterium]MDW8137081.1 metalloregulator ArsR/SmtB family transcription factor [Bacteroidota bacterium]MDW8285048.1 metalloregulator ArsR/SmtB family transcription factor [Bacteroidota bacterium]